MNKTIIHYKKGSRDLYCISSGLEKHLSVRLVTKYFNIVDEKNWSSFDEYAQNIQSINFIQWKSKEWIKSQCSCEWWAKNYCCHHVIGLAVYKNKAKYLDIHMEIPIGQCRKKGQPKKTISALNKQVDGLPLSSNSSSSESESTYDQFSEST